jgi:hypothetical protein
MHRRILSVPFVVVAAAGLTVLTGRPAAAAGDWECTIIVPAADQLQNGFDLVFPSGTPPWVAMQIRNALAPLHGLRGAAAVDLRVRSDMLASSIDNSDRYRPSSPGQIAGDLTTARQTLATARDYCAP